MSQSESNNSPLGMRIGESVFCIGYLVFALIAGNYTFYGTKKPGDAVPSFSKIVMNNVP